MKLTILIPTYNESDNMEKLLPALEAVSRRVSDVDFQVIIIDDSSPDGTADTVRRLSNDLNSNCFTVGVLVRQEKQGLGKAYIHGFKTVLGSKNPPDYILQMDADLSHDPHYIDDFLACAERGADFIIGTRYLEGGAAPDWSWYRKLLSRGGNLFARMMLGRQISDYTGGFNMYSIRLLRSLDLDASNHVGYGFLIDLKYHAMLHSKHLAQVPIVFMDRQHGNSKMPASTIVKNFLLVFKIKYRHMLGKE